jgi:hypothetical protein
MEHIFLKNQRENYKNKKIRGLQRQTCRTPAGHSRTKEISREKLTVSPRYSKVKLAQLNGYQISQGELYRTSNSQAG